MKEINLHLPIDVLEALLHGAQTNVPFVTDELGFPLRILIWRAQKAPRARKFKSPQQLPKGEEKDHE